MEGEKGLIPTNQPVVLELFCSWACRLFPTGENNTEENNTGEKNISAKNFAVFCELWFWFSLWLWLWFWL